MSIRSYVLTFVFAVLSVSSLLMVPFTLSTPLDAKASGNSPTSWNPAVTCTPTVVRITDITDNQTGDSSFTQSPFSPGITTPVTGGDAKRWLTPGPTPAGWAAPGPPCSNPKSGETISLFVQINGLQRANLVDEDYSTNYDPANGGASHNSTGDTTFNLFDPILVPNFSNSCQSAADPTCYARIHGEIDHDWKAAGYCGPGTTCDKTALESQTVPASTLIDVQGFVYWDPDHIGDAWHSFNGWEIHPLTAWRVSPSQQGSVDFSWSPSNPQLGQPINFTAKPGNQSSPSNFNWDFGDGVTASGRSVSHIYITPQAFNIHLTIANENGTIATTHKILSMGSWNPAVPCTPTVTTLENVIGNITIPRIISDPNSTGTDYTGGGYDLDGTLPYGSNPGLWPFFRRDLNPPCSVSGIPSFVEFHNVTVTGVDVSNCGNRFANDNGGESYPNSWQSCDTTFNLVTPGYGDSSTCPKCYTHKIYGGIDADWNASDVAPPTAPAEGQRIDIQGFIYWDNSFTNASWHSYTGWEIHPLTAWRPTSPLVESTITLHPSNSTTSPAMSFIATAFGGTGPYTFNWDFGDGAVALGNPVSHLYPYGTYTVHLAIRDSQGTLSLASLSFNQLQADINHDCKVNIFDLTLVGASFGSRIGDAAYDPSADVNSDGIINIIDLVLVGSSFGGTC